MKEEEQAHKNKKQNLQVILEINEAIASELISLLELNEFKQKYEGNVHFTGKKQFEEILHHLIHSLSKVSNQKEESLVSTSHFRKHSHKFLITREHEKAEEKLEVDLEASFRNYDFSFEEQEEFSNKLTMRKKSSRKNTIRTELPQRLRTTLPEEEGK